MRAIIIGAGRGRRLMPTTADAPKCFAEVQGRRILDWGLEALAANGITEICFVGGYQIDRVRTEYPGFVFRHNAEWENNNIMVSLMQAEDLMTGPFICAYADILFTGAVVRRLLECSGEIALSVDIHWSDRYRHRTQHPPDDAEKVVVRNGRVVRIDRRIASAEAHGEYTGLARFRAAGAALLREHYGRCRSAYAGKPFRGAAVFEKAYLIQLFQEMIERGVAMTHADTPGEYMEVDTQQDFDLARQYWRS